MINIDLVRCLIAEQFPQWKDLTIRAVMPGGWDNRTFRLGDRLLVRLPSAEAYAAQVEKEQHWLPKLAPLLPLSIPVPVSMGMPFNDYRWKWSIYQWIEGDAATVAGISDMRDFAMGLAQFLLALQHIEVKGGPLPGPHNFYRGGPLMTYDAQTRKALEMLGGKIDTQAATQVWEMALATVWSGSMRWVHGDISAANLLVRKGRLDAVIDFGLLAVGDPACDLTIAWTLFDDESRDVFRATLSPEPDLWARARAWALWKALITVTDLTDPNSVEIAQSACVIDKVLADYKDDT